MDDFLKLENRPTREILRMRRVRDAQGQVVFIVPERSLPAGADGPPLHVHFQEHEEIVVKAGTLGAQVGTEKIPQVFLIAGGTRATVCWILAATQTYLGIAAKTRFGKSLLRPPSRKLRSA